MRHWSPEAGGRRNTNEGLRVAKGWGKGKQRDAKPELPLWFNETTSQTTPKHYLLSLSGTGYLCTLIVFAEAVIL